MERIPIFYFRLGRKSFNVLPGSFHSSHPCPSITFHTFPSGSSFLPSLVPSGRYGEGEP